MRVILVDDHQLIRDGLARSLHDRGHEVVGQAHSLSSARLVLATTTSDLAIIDLSLPDGSGLELISQQIPFLVLTLGEDADSLRAAYEKGAYAYVRKSAPVSELMKVIARIEAGERPFHRPTPRQDNSGLSDRELEVLRVLANGWSTREIASHLFLSESTVKTHLAAINRKLSVNSRTMAIAQSRSLGLIE